MINFATLRFSLFATIIFITSATASATSIERHLENAPLQILTLSAGTQVSVMLNESLDLETLAIGNSIDFTVRSNVVVNGKVVIAAGSIGTGWIKNLKKSCGGKCAEITISAESAQAVDGQTVNLRSIPHTVKATCCKGSTTVNIGTNLTAHVLNDIKING